MVEVAEQAAELAEALVVRVVEAPGVAVSVGGVMPFERVRPGVVGLNPKFVPRIHRVLSLPRHRLGARTASHGGRGLSLIGFGGPARLRQHSGQVAVVQPSLFLIQWVVSAAGADQGH